MRSGCILCVAQLMALSACYEHISRQHTDLAVILQLRNGQQVDTITERLLDTITQQC